jgi:ABC-type branched-subunit amino acid transport system ATPase component
VAPADRGAIVFDGRDITHMPPDEIAPLGIAQVPGGQGVFPSLTVGREPPRGAGWMLRHDTTSVPADPREALELFPVLRQRIDDPAADLSGGQQQMLALAMAYLSAEAADDRRAVARAGAGGGGAAPARWCATCATRGPPSSSSSSR